MMGFTLLLVLQSPGPTTTSTMAMAVFFSPFFYLPILVASYLLGSLVARF